jgi:hypothetical protein
MYRYRRRPLLLVQVNTDKRKRIFYVCSFTHLITDSNAYCLTVCFFSFLPQI